VRHLGRLLALAGGGVKRMAHGCLVKLVATKELLFFVLCVLGMLCRCVARRAGSERILGEKFQSEKLQDRNDVPIKFNQEQVKVDHGSKRSNDLRTTCMPRYC
jgi:hypothetical protein